MSILSWSATGGGWDDPLFSRAWDGPALTPNKGDLTLSGSIPFRKREYFISPDVANLEIVWNTGPIPQVAVGTDDSVDKADLTFTAYSPDIGRMYKFVITAPTQTLTGFAPVDGTGFVISPDKASIQILQTYGWDNYGGLWSASSDNWDVTPFVPDAVEAGQNQPGAGSLSLTGSSPDFNLAQLWYVSSGSMSLTGFLPLSTTGHIFTPDKADLTGLDLTKWSDASGGWSSSSDSWGVGTLSPSAGVTYTFTIDSAGNLVFVPQEIAWPYVGQPKYVSEIIVI